MRDLLADLSPIEMPAPEPAASLRGPAQITVVAGDFHWPQHDEACENILLRVIDDIVPGLVILNGDLCDFNAISRYPRDPLTENWSLMDERRDMWEFLHRLERVMHRDAMLFETSANHSGGSREGRWRRYLSERIPEIASDPLVAEALSYKKMFHPPWSRISEAEEYVQIVPGLIALHGDVVRKNAAYSAVGMVDKWQVSLIHNHSHRMGHTSYRVPAIGTRPEGLVRAYEAGCMCKLTPTYGKGYDWQNGFCVVEHDGTDFNVVPIHIHNNKAMYQGRVYHG